MKKLSMFIIFTGLIFAQGNDPLNLNSAAGSTLLYQNQNNTIIVYGAKFTQISNNIYWIKNCRVIVNNKILLNLNQIMTIDDKLPMEQSVSLNGYIVEATEKDDQITSLLICQADETGNPASDFAEIILNGDTYKVNF